MSSSLALKLVPLLCMLAFGGKVYAHTINRELSAKCPTLNRSLATLLNASRSRKVGADRIVNLLPGEVLLITDFPPPTTSKFDERLSNATKDPLSKTLLSTDLKYLNQRLIITEKEIIPNGYRNNTKEHTRAVQMASKASAVDNLYNVSETIRDPGVKEMVQGMIHSRFPNASCKRPRFA